MMVQDVWRDIVRRSLLFFNVLTWLQLFGKSKIDELDALLDVALLDEDQVLRFYVTMHYTHAV